MIKSSANNSVIFKPKIQESFSIGKINEIKMSNQILKILNFGLGHFLKMLLSKFMRFFKLVDHKILNFATKTAKLLELVSVLPSPD